MNMGNICQKERVKINKDHDNRIITMKYSGMRDLDNSKLLLAEQKMKVDKSVWNFCLALWDFQISCFLKNTGVEDRRKYETAAAGAW